jgi:lysophospholipase L1-like esterase
MKINKFLKKIGFSSLMIAAALTLAACSDHDDVVKLENDSTIVAFGDSLTYGYGALSDDDTYPSQLEKITGYTVINAGVNGDTAHAGVKRIRKVVQEHNPELVLVSLGGNDMLRKQDKDLEANLSAIVEYLISRNIQVVLIAEPQPSVAFLVNSLNDAEVYQTVAKKYDIPLIENVFSKYLSEYKYKSDTIHLNSEGYELVAEDVAKELKSFGLID